MHTAKSGTALVLDRRPPSRAEPGPSSAIVRIKAVSLSYRDSVVMQNASGDMRDGLVASSDATGIVERSIAAIASGGSIAQIGALTGFGLKPNLSPLKYKSAYFHGICVGSGEHLTDLNRFLEEESVRPIIDWVFTFDDGSAAFDYLKSAQHFGKIVIEQPTLGHG